MKPRLLSIAVIFMVIIGFAAAGDAADVIKIGVVAPLSAPGGVETGQALVDGAKIAAEEINNAGGLLGQKVELVIGDTSGLPENGFCSRSVSFASLMSVALST